jgi:hypothetical protein
MAKECEHEEVIWEPIQMEYDSDGTASVWQEGRCQECEALLQVDYEPGEIRTVSDEQAEEAS